MVITPLFIGAQALCHLPNPRHSGLNQSFVVYSVAEISLGANTALMNRLKIWFHQRNVLKLKEEQKSRFSRMLESQER